MQFCLWKFQGFSGFLVVLHLGLWITMSTSDTRIFMADEWEGTAEKNIYLSTMSRKFHDDIKYLVLASNTVRPGQVYRVCVSLLSNTEPLKVRASLHRDGEQVVSATELVDPQYVATLLMQVPFNAIHGAYRLKVEGNVNGDLGGSGFSNETEVTFSERFLTILIQTNQLVYNYEQMMHIRIILLTTELRPFAEPIDVYLVDSRNFIMKRWVSVYPYLGFVNLEFQLPYDYPTGWWTIRAVALGQTEETRVLLERWFSHRFDVNLGTPTFVLNTEEYLEGQLLANFTNVATVTGNATLKTFLRPLGRYRELNLDWSERYIEEYVNLFHGTYDFKISMSHLRNLASPVPLENCEIEVQAVVGERFFDFSVNAYSRVRVVNSSISLRFLGVKPQNFKPGMPFKTHMAVSFHDLVPLPSEKLSTSMVLISPIAVIDDGRRVELPSQELNFNGEGVLELVMDTPRKAERIIIRAYYEDKNDVYSRARTELTVLAHFTQQNRFMKITSSTKRAKAEEYAVFHVWANFYLRSFNYLVIAKGIIVQSGTEKVLGMIHSITTFSVPVSPEMAPAFDIVVYHVTPDGEVLTDSVFLPVDALNKQKFVLDVNMKQERSGNEIELIPRLTSETIVGLSGFDIDHISTHGRRQLTPSSIMEAMYGFEKDYLKFQRAFWRHRDGSQEDTNYYITHSFARDTKDTFAFSNLVIFTNLLVSSLPSFCNSSGLSSCLSGQCYSTHKQCDGIQDCDDGTDEGSCFNLHSNEDKDLFEFYLYRRNRQGAFFDATAGNFAWSNKIIGEDQEEYVATTSPKGPSSYALNAVAMSKVYGLHILPEPVMFDSTKPFFIIAEAPDTAVIGEQIGIRVSVINYQFIEIKAEVILAASDDYRFVQVEPLGIVSSYNPRTSSGELQHLIYVKPVSHVFVHVPIVATKIGTIEVVITGKTQVAKDITTLEINIIPDGVSVSRHTSMLLDMRNEAYIIRYLDVNVTEDPIIPYEETYRRYIFGSPKASVTLIGDVVGMPFPSDPKSPIGLGALKNAEAVKSGEYIMFDFAYTLYTLIYLRLTNQLPMETMRGMLDYLNKAYVYQSVFYKNGAYTMFKGEQPSLWLTAYCARIFHMAQYPDWENYLFIDPELLMHSMEYILKYQARDGSFYEIVDHPWNRKMNIWGSRSNTNFMFQNVSLTAHVLITLTAVSDLPGDIRVDISNARSLAARFLERRLPQLTDPYQVAIVTYALLEAGSVEAEVGFNKLDSLKREREGMVYWSPEPISSAEILYQNQRPFVLPRLPNKYDSFAVEATAYALLVYVRYNGVIQDQIVKWLNTMRTTDESFISSQDTIVAMQALIEYSFRTHVRDITNMKVSVESSSNAGQMHSIGITSDNLAEPKKVPISPYIWGHVEVVAQGAGLSVLQLDVEYNVDKSFLLIPPPVESFDLTVRGFFHGRNKSHMAIRSCARWTYTEESDTSGVAVMEISLPTGYNIYKPDLDNYVYSKTVPRLQRGRVFPKSAVFMFDYLDTSWLCVNFTVQRWYPVANLTRFLKAKVYDYYTPERYKEIIYEDFDLYVLNVCEVCGSYQCPYCPHFSFGARPDVQWTVFVLMLIIGKLLRVQLKAE